MTILCKTSKMSDAESSSDESLNIRSEKFDPLKALYSSNIRGLASNVQVYDNVSRYEAVSKGLSRGTLPGRDTRKENAEIDSNRRRFLPHQVPIQSTSRSSKSSKYETDDDNIIGEKNVLARMKGTLGPLEMLLRCMEDKKRVKVYTRGARSIRGYVLAYVAAFDKHWNLALEDCLEVWSRKVKRKAPALGIPEDDEKKICDGIDNLLRIKEIVKETKGKIETVERHVPQMMIRGEQIAIIVKID